MNNLVISTITLFSLSVLGMVVKYYAPQMSKATRLHWAFNLLFLGTRIVLSFLNANFKDKLDAPLSPFFFQVANITLTILVCVHFIIYLHRRYGSEQLKKIKK